MKVKAASMTLLTLLIVCILTLAINTQLTESEPVEAPDIGLYWDFNCSKVISIVDWGGMGPGSSKNTTVFIRNEGNESVTLSMEASNWRPSEAANFVHLTWNYTEEIIEEYHVVPVKLSLHVDFGTKGISALAFDASFASEQDSLKTVVKIPMNAFIIAPTWNVDLNPDTLNLKSKGKWITCYIELPEGYDVNNVNRTTILLNATIPVDSFWVDKPLESVVGDYDNDTIPDLMVKFSRAAVIDYYNNQNITNENITLTVAGELYDGTSFEDNDMIRVKMPDTAIAKMSSEVNSDNEKILVMPEFSSFLVLPLFMMATLMAFIIYRKKQ